MPAGYRALGDFFANLAFPAVAFRSPRCAYICFSSLEALVPALGSANQVTRIIGRQRQPLSFCFRSLLCIRTCSPRASGCSTGTAVGDFP